ncbi:hypothetical protein KFL_001290230 [Klebsormidium nitens]|uniref:Desiccation-related protein PCC13-62 n=1 Tax=Klebsormidium nitens TaxID=105231 RepID=A0A1Y1HYW2_KLENI|nr:hypothetical protein KFL_001290230 [Klebsormidium nitens]|eukprot:GAQ82932.1 hypothetical protein KFL_001290230 [Klebsormidium nitens]
MARVALFAAAVAALVALAAAQSCPSADFTGCYTSTGTFFCCPTPATSCSGLSTPDCVATGTSNVVAGAGVVPGAPTPMPTATDTPAPTAGTPAPTAGPITDADILNFALNLEYLEGEFYSWAAFGKGLESSLTGGGGPVIGGQKASLSADAQAYAEQIAIDEINHVKFLRTALGDAAVPEPAIDIGPAFAVAANAAANATLDPPFSPYTDDVTFLLGAFIFEDVGVTAYGGAVPLFSDKNVAGVAARILGVEAYHAGAVRAELAEFVSVVTGYGVTVGDIGNLIVALRAALGGGKETPLVADGFTQLRAVTEGDSLTYVRTTSEVISIVCAGGNKGLFFPNGLNGKINMM